MIGMMFWNYFQFQQLKLIRERFIANFTVCGRQLKTSVINLVSSRKISHKKKNFESDFREKYTDAL